MHGRATKKGVKLTLTAKEARLLRALLATVTSTIDEQQEFLDAMEVALGLHAEKKRQEKVVALDKMHKKILEKFMTQSA